MKKAYEKPTLVRHMNLTLATAAVPVFSEEPGNGQGGGGGG